MRCTTICVAHRTTYDIVFMCVLDHAGVWCLAEIKHLNLQTLDVANNRIRELPHELRHVTSLQTLHLENNPLESPPAQVSGVTSRTNAIRIK